MRYLKPISRNPWLALLVVALMAAGALRAQNQTPANAPPPSAGALFDDSIYKHLAAEDRQQGRIDDARKELEKAAAARPDDLEVIYQLATLEEAAGNSDKAIQILQMMVWQLEKPAGQYNAQEANNRAIILERLGSIYSEQGKFSQAIDTFKPIQALGKDHAPHAEFLVAETLLQEHQSDQAQAELAAALQLYPKDHELNFVSASLLGKQGHVDEAVAQLQPMLTKTPEDSPIYIAMAQIYLQAKRFEEAEQAARKSQEMRPNQADQEYGLFVLGSIYEREKKYEMAEEAFKRVLAMDPQNAATSNYLGYMLADQGIRLEESVKYIKRAVDLDPNNAAYLDSLGWAFFKMKRYDLAEPPLEKAARLVPADPSIHEHLGSLYLQMGKATMAEKEWEQALKEWPQADSNDFDAESAKKLQKQLDYLKAQSPQQKPALN